MAAITCESITKTFKTTTVLNDITLTVEEGTRLGVVGPEGSGKTTLLKLMTGLLRPTSGSCKLFDKNVLKDPEDALKNVGCLVGEPALYGDFTAEENLHLFGNLLKADPEETMKAAGITFGSTRVKHLTPSMRKHLAIAVALLGKPRLLLLDEPLTLLDEPTKAHIKTLLSEKGKELTILFTTPSPKEVKDLAAQPFTLTKDLPQKEVTP